jgi:phosphoribosylformimino-5-aminoimidazole carboxamide ribotide isomerase
MNPVDFFKIPEQGPQHQVPFASERLRQRFPCEAAAGNIFEYENLHENVLEIIPVIDIKGGKAVHAKQGLRERYAPLATRLCPEGDPGQLACALLSLYPFSTIYLADLDALMGRGSNLPMMRNLVGRFPETVFWIDQGLPAMGFRAYAKRPWIPVVGSESLSDSVLEYLSLRSTRMILSLDFTSAGLNGPGVLLESDALWPESVILMNLDSVGGGEGPNWERLSYFKSRWPERQFIAAGGVRHEEDLKRLADLGFSSALIASALHRETVDATSIARVMLG